MCVVVFVSFFLIKNLCLWSRIFELFLFFLKWIQSERKQVWWIFRANRMTIHTRSLVNSLILGRTHQKSEIYAKIVGQFSALFFLLLFDENDCYASFQLNIEQNIFCYISSSLSLTQSQLLPVTVRIARIEGNKAPEREEHRVVVNFKTNEMSVRHNATLSGIMKRNIFINNADSTRMSKTKWEGKRYEQQAYVNEIYFSLSYYSPMETVYGILNFRTIWKISILQFFSFFFR